VTVLYAESSAVLSWLLGEPRQRDVVAELSKATNVVTSSITAIECSRALLRARVDRRLSAAEEMAALRMLDEAVERWTTLGISTEVDDRARREFPREPVRTLDAVHLATASVFAEALGEIRMLSLDDRVRANAKLLGMSIAI
jgi:predicted nucleic acid-binding protein